MLISKTVEVNITHRNKNIYMQKGYKEVIVGNSTSVLIKDLPKSSGQLLNVKCDYCSENYEIRFCDYTRTKYDFLDKDACKKCWHRKRMEITDYKIENDIETGAHSGRIGYWHKRDNVINEVSQYIERNGRIGKEQGQEEENNRWYMIHWALKENKIELDDILTELEYDREQLQRRNPNGYVIPFQELKEKIEEFIEEFDVFPSQSQLSKDLKINNKMYSKHGTLDEIRQSLGYGDNKHLIDKREYINKSSYELITANYLIAQEIPYKREQHPFKKFDETLNYKSDFTFYLKNKEIHVEVWGGMKTFNNQREFYDYDEIMEEKLRLYNLYDIELISVNPEIFHYSMSRVKDSLYTLISPYMNLPFIKVEDRLVSTFRLHKMDDEKLIEEIMNHSEYKNILPSYGTLRENNHEFLFVEVLKRYDSLEDFANNFDVITAYKARSKKYKKILK